MESGERRGRRPGRSPLERIAAGMRLALDQLRTLGPGGWLQMEKEAFVQTAKVTGACLIAWWLAAAVLRVDLPVLAPIGVLLTVSATAYSTVVRAVQQVGAVIVGVTAASGLTWLLGPNSLTLAVLVVAGLVLTRLLTLPAQNVQIPITALLVFALGNTYGLERLIDLLLGAGLGIAANLLVFPPRYVEQAAGEVRALSEEMAGLCDDMAQGLRGAWDEDQARDWLDRARALAHRLESTRDAADQASESVRLSLRRHRYKPRLRQVAEAATCVDHACQQVRGIARGLVDLVAGARGLPGEAAAALPEPLSRELEAVSRVFAAFARIQAGGDGADDEEELRELRAALHAGETFQHQLAGALDPADQEELWSLYGALLDDCARIRHEFDPAGPHRAAYPRPEQDAEPR
ncbi:FUSC family protein [Nonomuraea pusilla]|uniref:FUSC family protein n=1 Tax=Nonomuraea pusilla TaxID=46177 RepID=UPI00332A8C32